MPTYIYETVPESCCDDPKHYEIEQNENDQPLTKHPETGEVIKLVVIGGQPLVKQEDEGDSCCSGTGCC